MEHELLTELQRTNRLLSLLLVADLEQGEAVKKLDLAGLPPKDIASIVGTTPNTVSVTLSKARTANAKKAKKKTANT